MPNVVYKWNPRPGFDFKADPQSIGEHLEELSTATGGVTPAAIVEDARNQASPLHDCFEWDDVVAGEAWRKHTARQLVGSLVVVKVNQTQVAGTVRAFVNVKEGTKESFYSPVVRVMEDTALRSQVLDRARKELVQWRNRYSDLSEFAKVFTLIDSLAA